MLDWGLDVPDVHAAFVFVITVYEPTEDRWEAGFMRRRR